MRSNTLAKPIVWGTSAMLAVGLAACSASEPGTSSSASSPASSDASRAASAPAAESLPGGQEAGGVGTAATVAWRGAEVRVPAGWRKASVEDDFLCILPADVAETVCASPGHDAKGVQNFVLMYASERKANQEAPADPKTLDGSDMDFWMYNGGEVPCDDWSRNQQVDGATKTVGGLQALYGKWMVTCKTGGKSFTAQRWLLPKSRLGVVSYALTDKSAAEIFEMISTMDMSGYEPSDTPMG